MPFMQSGPMMMGGANAYGQSIRPAPLSGSVQRNGPNPYQMDPRNGPIPGVGTMPNPGLGPSFNSSIMQNMNQMKPSGPLAPNPGGMTTQPMPNPQGPSQGPMIPPNPQANQNAMNQMAQGGMALGQQLGMYGPNQNLSMSPMPNVPMGSNSGNPQMNSINNMVGTLGGGVNTGGMMRPLPQMSMGQSAANPMGNYMQQQRKTVGLGPTWGGGNQRPAPPQNQPMGGMNQ